MGTLYISCFLSMSFLSTYIVHYFMSSKLLWKDDSSQDDEDDYEKSEDDEDNDYKPDEEKQHEKGDFSEEEEDSDDSDECDGCQQTFASDELKEAEDDKYLCKKCFKSKCHKCLRFGRELSLSILSHFHGKILRVFVDSFSRQWHLC